MVAGQGNIRILFNEVQIMGGESPSKTDGATTGVAGDDQFDSASSTFQTDGVKPGDMLTIVGGVDAGTYTITVVNSETQLHISGDWPVGGLTGQTFSITQYNFGGGAPDGNVIGPQGGSIIYRECQSAGMFDFHIGQSHGADVNDWISVERIILYLDEADITDVKLVIEPPEGSDYEAPFIRDLTEWTNAGMERLLFLNSCGLKLRPGSKLKLTTSGANGPQAAEVWWERARQITQDPVTGNERFPYGV